METTEFVIDGNRILIDAQDAHLIDGAKRVYIEDGWSGCKYAFIQHQGKKTPLHRVIMKTKAGLETDHRNSDGLDNRRANLRNVTHRQNALNSIKHKVGVSKFKGLYYVARIDCWRVRIRLDGSRLNLGYFKSEIEAAYAYDMASIEHHGEFGRRNFLPLM